MIIADQFANLPDGLLLAFSSRQDGTMLNRAVGVHNASIVHSRGAFCQSVGVNYADVVYQWIVYGDDQTYDHLVTVGSQATTRHTEAVQADGLVTSERGVGLLLPVADCVATVLYDDVRKVLVLLHLGRHSTLTDLLPNTIATLQQQGSNVGDIRVWMAPAVQRQSYRLAYFAPEHDPVWQGFFDKQSDGYYIDLPGYNRAVCVRHGIPEVNITVSPVDTATHPNYFSHSQGDTTGRMCVLAMMK